MKALVIIAVLLAAADVRANDDTAEQQVVVVNAATDPSSAGPIARLRRVLGSRNLLVKLDDHLAATLDGRSSQITSIDAIKEAYATADFDAARALIDDNEQRILAEPVARDPSPQLAQLSQWRGLVAAATGEPDEAVRWFRAALRFNPAWVIDSKLASPRVRSLIKRAKREPDETGKLRVRSDPEDAMVSIDGGQPKPVADRTRLPVGIHLVIITAPQRKPYAELVDITEDLVFRLDISLDPESTVDRAARLVDATAAAPAGRPRLKRAMALAKLTGAPRMLVIEEGGAERVKLRLYDVEAKKVSKTVELDGSAPSAAIAREIVAALESENLMSADSIRIETRRDAPPKRWYKRWYVWAAAATVVGLGGYAAYDYASREPVGLRGL